MSLKVFHLAFILLAILGADYFGVWSVWTYPRLQDPLILGLGIVCMIGGLGLVFYAIRLVRRFDAEQIG